MGTASRLRFGIVLALTTLVAVQAADVVTGRVPPTPSVALAGKVEVSTFQVIGGIGSVRPFVYERTYVCAPCAIKMSVVDAALLQVGNGRLGPLDSGANYTVAAFTGEVSVRQIRQLPECVYELVFAGGADAVRVSDPDWR